MTQLDRRVSNPPLLPEKPAPVKVQSRAENRCGSRILGGHGATNRLPAPSSAAREGARDEG